MKKYGKYYQTTLHLDDKEQERFIKLKLGIKKIFLTGMIALENKIIPPETKHIQQEE